MVNNRVEEVSAKYLVDQHSLEGLAEEGNREGNSVPEGYKQTEVGVIPEDWQTLELKDVCKEIGDGIHATPVYSIGGRYFFINGNNIRSGSVNLSSDVKTVDENEFVKHGKRLGKDTIFLSINGTIGNLAFYNGEPLVLGKSVAYLIFHDGISKHLIYFLLQTPKTRKFFDDGLTGSTIKNLGLSTIRRTPIPFPPRKEQTAIANALSDVDALISTQESLIAKKQAIKTATMQQLLAGRTRLPQFALREDGSPKGYKQSELGEVPEDWVENSVGSLVATLEAGVSVNSIDGAEVFSHGMHVLKTSCVDGGYFDPTEIKSIQPRDIHRAKCSPKKDAIIVSRMNTPALVGEIGYVDRDYPTAFLPDRLWQIRFRQDIKLNSRWLAYLLSFSVFAIRIKESATGTSGSMKNISKYSFLSLKIPTPSDKEQTAIATILSDMDQEIQTLEQRLNKTRQIKQGMMQQLLTGKIRLVKPEACQ